MIIEMSFAQPPLPPADRTSGAPPTLTLKAVTSWKTTSPPKV
jgi:hypothetical protein